MATRPADLTLGKIGTYIGWGIAALVVVIGAWLYAQRSLNHDAAVYLLIARALVDGRILYENFPDYSMPANAWLAIVSLWIANELNVSLAYLHQTILFLITTAGAAVTGLIVARTGAAGSVTSLLMPPFIMWLFLIVPGYDFGQRDVLFAVLAAPLVGMTAARHFGAKPSWCLSITIAVLAAMGSSLKPHVGLPLIVLGLSELALRRGRIQAIARELWITAGILGFYLVAVKFLYPTYFSEVLSNAAKINGFIQMDIIPVLLSLLPAAVTGVFATFLLSMILVRRFQMRRHIPWGLIIAWAAFGVALALMKFLQFQPFRYHAIPVLLYASTSAGLFAAINIQEAVDGWSNSPRTAATFSIVTATLGMMVMATPSLSSDGLSRAATLADPVTRTLQLLPRGTYILAFQTGVRPISPLHAYADIRWSGEFNENHEIAALVGERDVATAAGRPIATFFVALERQIRHAVLRSLTLRPPELVLVDVSRPLRWFEDHEQSFDLLSWFKQDPAFVSAWSAYEYVETVPSLGSRRVEVWRRHTLPTPP